MTSDLRTTLRDRIEKILPSTEFRRMVSAEDKEAAYRLRYDAYRRENRIPEDDARISIDFADVLPNTDTYGIFVGGKLCSSIRVSVLTTTCPKSPSVDVFQNDLRRRITDGVVIIDPTRFVTSMEAAEEMPELPFLTLRVPAMACEHYEADECLSTVRLNHRGFYKRVFRATPITEPIYYPPMNMQVQLMTSTPDDIREGLFARYPFFNANYVERRQIFGPPDRVPGIERQLRSVS